MATSLLHDFPQPQDVTELPKRLPAVEEAPIMMPTLAPLELLRIAVSQNADVDRLTKLLDLQERWERNEARKGFVVAMNAFKSNPPTILKNRHVSIERKDGTRGGEYNHATLDNVCRAVIRTLSKHGISHRWKIEQDKDWIKVSCVLTHSLGHSEETTLHGAPDQTGSKNAVQAIASTVTYLERYTLLAACGLAAQDTDTDGTAPAISLERVRECCESMQKAQTMDQLKAVFRIAYSEADQAKDRDAMAAYIRAKDARKAALR